MSSQNKVLLSFIALVAFVVGIAMNTSRPEVVSEASALLSAKLETSNPSTGESGVGTVEENLSKLTLVNFWATWCSPCRQEMPLFETMTRLHGANGFGVIGVAIDNPSTSQPFLDEMDIRYPILYAERTGMELMSLSGNEQGLLPYSLLIDENGQVIDQVLGKIDEAKISAWISEHL